MRRIALLLMLAGGLAAGCGSAHAAAVVKTNVAPIWLDARSWEPWGEPEEGHDVLLNQTGSTVIYGTWKSPIPCLSSLTIDAEGTGTGMSLDVPVGADSLWLRTFDAVIGKVHQGWLGQTFGLVTVNENLVLGMEAGSSGTYRLWGLGGLEVFADEVIGWGGSGTMDQEGAYHMIVGNLYLGYDPTGQGTYNSSALGSVTVYQDVFVGYQGTGMLTSSASQANEVRGHLVLGRTTGSFGRVALSGFGYWKIGRSEVIGDAGRGELTEQGVNSHEIGLDLVLGSEPGSDGKFDLLAGGLTVGREAILGRGGLGVFNHMAGRVSIGSNLVLGQDAVGVGHLKSSGEVNVAGFEMVGGFGSGSYSQMANLNTVYGDLVLGNAAAGSGSYQVEKAGGLKVMGDAVIGRLGSGSLTHASLPGRTEVQGSLILAQGEGATGSFHLVMGELLSPRLQINQGGTFLNELPTKLHLGNVEQNGGTFSSPYLWLRPPPVAGLFDSYVTHYTLAGGDLQVSGIGDIPGLPVVPSGQQMPGIFVEEGATLTQTGGAILSPGIYQNGGEINGALVNLSTFTKVGGVLKGETRNLGNMVLMGGLTEGSLHSSSNILMIGGRITASVENHGQLLQIGGDVAGSLLNEGLFTYNDGEFSGRLVNRGVLAFTNLSVGLGVQNDVVLPLLFSQTLRALGPEGLRNDGTLALAGGDLFTSDTVVGFSGWGTVTQAMGRHIISGTLSLGHQAGSGGSYCMLGGQLAAGALEIHAGGSWQYVNGTVTFGDVRQDGGSYRAMSLPIGGGQSISKYSLTAGAIDVPVVELLPGGELIQNGGTVPRVFQSGGTIRGVLNNQSDFTYAGGAFEGTLLNRGGVLLQRDFTAENGWRNQSSFDLPPDRTLTLNGLGLVNENTFNLMGNLIATNEVIGQAGAGRLVQQGGQNRIQSTLTLGGGSEGSGTYALQAGQLSAETIRIQQRGELTQQGGQAMARAAVIVDGDGTSTNGRYALGNGVLSTPTLVLIHGGTVLQTGGTNQVGGTLQMASTWNAQNRYELQGGACNLEALELESGTFAQTGGLLSISNLTLTDNGLVKGFVHSNGVFQADQVRQNAGVFSTDKLVMGALEQPTNQVRTFTLRGGRLQAGALQINDGAELSTGPGVLEIPRVEQFGGSSQLDSLQLGVNPEDGFGHVLSWAVSGGSLTMGRMNLITGGTFSQTGGSVRIDVFNQLGGAVEGTYENRGTFNYGSGEFNGRLINRGTLNYPNNLVLADGLENHSSLTLNYGQRLTLNGRGLDNQGEIVLNWGGSIAGTGQLNLVASSNTFRWNSGIVDGVVGVGPGGALYLAGAGNKQSFGKVVNAGDSVWEDGGYYGNANAVFENRGTWTLAGSCYFNAYYGVMTVNNSGLLRKTSDTITVVDAIFNNSGQVEVERGQLLLNQGGTNSGEFRAGTNVVIGFTSGIHRFKDGGRLVSRDGLILVGDGGGYASLALDEGATFPVSGNLALHNQGALDGKGILTVARGEFDWSAGIIRCTVDVTSEQGRLLIQGPGNKQISGVLRNGGEGAWLSGDIYGEAGSVFENTGTFLIQCDRKVSDYYSFLTIKNAGVLRKTDSIGRSDLSVRLLNDGLVAADSGEMTFHYGGTNRGEFHVETNASIALDGGAHVFRPGTRITGEGWLSIGGGAGYASLSVPGGEEVALGGKVALQPGGWFPAGGGLLRFTNGCFLWNGGLIASTITIAPETGRMLWASPGSKQLSGARIDNLGLGIWSGGTIFGDPGSVLHNEGTFLITSDDKFSSYYGYMTIENVGELIKTNGIGNSSIGATLDNAGLVRVDSGYLSLDGPVLQFTNGTLTAGRWYAAANSYIITDSSIRLFRNRAEVILDGAGAVFTGFTWLAENYGSVVLLHGQQFATRTSLVDAGAVRIDATSQLTVNGPMGMEDTSVLDLELAAPGPGRPAPLTVTAHAFLAGKLVIRLGPGFQPSSSDSFNLVQYGTLLGGRFRDAADNQRVATADGAGSFRITYGPTVVQLTDYEPGLPGSDADADGIADDWARRYFGQSPLPDGTGADEKFGDKDGDGMSNYQEFLAGTDPTDSRSVLHLSIQLDAETSAIALEAQTVPERNYRLWQSSDLAHWTEWTGPSPSRVDPDILRWIIPAPLPSGESLRYFRIGVE